MMALKSPSRIMFSKTYNYSEKISYHVRFVQMGKAVLFSSMEKSIAMKPLSTPSSNIKSVSYLGMVENDTLMDYPFVPPSSSSKLLSKLPPEIVSSIQEDFVSYRKKFPISDEIESDKTSVVLVYKIIKR